LREQLAVSEPAPCWQVRAADRQVESLLRDHWVMDTGRESEVVQAFVGWLEQNGWTVATEVAWADVVAERGEKRLVAEAKGVTTSPGLDIDTLYGQLLRRMTDFDSTSYAVVVPEKLIQAASRVPEAMRARLRITLFGIDMDDVVREH
jgi:hypothetical protein